MTTLDKLREMTEGSARLGFVGADDEFDLLCEARDRIAELEAKQLDNHLMAVTLHGTRDHIAKLEAAVDACWCGIVRRFFTGGRKP